MTTNDTKPLVPGTGQLCQGCAERYSDTIQGPRRTLRYYICRIADRALMNPGYRIEAGQERCDWFTPAKREG